MEEIMDLIKNCDNIWEEEEEKRVINVLKTWKNGERKDRRDYHLHEKYAIQTFAGLEKIITKKAGLIMATKGTTYQIVKDIHISCGHKGDRSTHQKIRENYVNISRKIVEAYVRQCERCTEKLKKKETKGIVIKPITAKEFNDRAQIDLVDFQSLPDGEFKWVMHYQDHLTKYHLLRPLRLKTASNVAEKVFDIFIDFGAPCILQSDNGREFTANIIKVSGIQLVF